MPTPHRMLAVLVAVVWGVNFLAIHASLETLPPFLCAALRWTLLAVPAVLLVPRPQVPWRWLVGYGVGFGILQFAFLYAGMAAGMPAGLASLVLQSSAPFTVLLGALLLREPLRRPQAVGVAVAVLGLALVGVQRVAGAAWWPFVLTVLGGLGWALGNLAARQARAARPFHLVLWMSIVPPLPLLALSLAVEGPDRIESALAETFSTAGLPSLVGLAYTCLIGTVVGSGVWTWLMARHPASAVAPYSMLVPVTGLAVAAAVLGERPTPLDLLGGTVVIAGVLWGGRQPRVGPALFTGSQVLRGTSAEELPEIALAVGQSRRSA